eukprot:3620229-Pleurochrysis_carterae.AAC.1
MILTSHQPPQREFSRRSLPTRRQPIENELVYDPSPFPPSPPAPPPPPDQQRCRAISFAAACDA